MSSASAPVTESAQLNCPECGTSITYYDVKGSSFYVCPHCHTYFEYEGEQRPKTFGKYEAAPPPESSILPIGTRGTLHGRKCRIVGMVQRREVRYSPSWLEYQVFFPDKQEYQQLALFEGHWLLVQPAPTADASYTVEHATAPIIRTDEGTYRLYNRYQARVLWAQGEFDWNIEGDNDLILEEFICPPTMLVREIAAGQPPRWYVASHLEPTAIAAAFSLNVAQLPERIGVGAVQPEKSIMAWPVLRRLTLWATGLLLATQLLLAWLQPREVLLEETLFVQAEPGTPGTNKVLVSTPFTVPAESPALSIDLEASLDNQWLELPVSVVNEQTGRGFEFTKNIEFYSGYEGGESWSEGGREAEGILSAVPAGRYHLNLYPFTETGVAPVLHVKVSTRPVLWSNLLLALGLVLAYPLARLAYRYYLNTRRWSSSDFNPYAAD